MRKTLFLAAFAALAGCVPSPPQTQAPPPPSRDPGGLRPPPAQPAPPRVTGARAPEILNERGLEAIIRRDARDLTRRFGAPRLDVREGDMRKLQFQGEACVLDIFLYPLRPGEEPVATWVEARRHSDGAEVDRGACAAALARGR